MERVPLQVPNARDPCERGGRGGGGGAVHGCRRGTHVTVRRGRSAAEQPSRTTLTPARSGVMASDALLNATCVHKQPGHTLIREWGMG
jgi:hypothetical protein